MAFNTKLKLIDAKFEQPTGGTLTLSGDTTIADSGELKYASHPTFSQDEQIVDKKYVDDNIVSGTTSASTYNLLSPAALDLGGIEQGYVLTGKTTNCILQDLLFPELCGTLTAPSTSTSLSVSGTYEVGCQFASVVVTSTFNQGCIDPQYQSTCDKRSGDANAYCFTGTGMPSGAQNCDELIASQTATTYTVVNGSNTWGSCTFFDAGVQPVSNKGNNFSSPLSADNTTGDDDSFTGLYPYFYGSSASDPTLNSALLATGSKVVAGSTGQLNINYGTTSGVYLWFATPATSQTKQGWYGGPTNRGNIGQQPTDVWDAPATVSVDSPSACWSSISYKIYKTNVQTSTTGTVICMTNNTQQ